MEKVNVAVESVWVDKETDPEGIVRFRLWIKSTDVETFRSVDFSYVGYPQDGYRLFDGDNAEGNFEVVQTRDQLSLIDGWFNFFGNSIAVFYDLTGIQMDWRRVN